MESWRFQDLLPVSEQRVPPTWSNLAAFLAPVFFGYYAMAVLVQLPRTKLYRVALLPLVFWLAIKAGTSLDFSGGQSEYLYFNKALALAMFHMALRAATWTLADEPYVKNDHNRARSSNGIADKVNSESLANDSDDVRSAMLNACDLCNNLRGLGWNWSTRIYVRSPTFKIESKLIFAVLNFGRFFLYMTIGDAVDLCVRAFAPPGSAGWSIFDPTLPPIQRYLQSTIITILSGVGGISVVEMVYSFTVATSVVLFRQHPSEWPPLFDKPWLATSLAQFWGRSWHQLFRDCFVACGYKPLEGILGRYAVIGAFVVSGVLHEVGMRGMGRGDALYIVGYFVMQGVGVALERLWRQLTGRQVDGPLGWLWVLVWQSLWGNYLVDAWAQGGLIARSALFPIRPVTWALTSTGLLANRGA